MSKPILHLFWIAEYDDGTALPQFDPDTGEEHLFSEIDQARLARFGWYAFPPELAQKVDNAVVNPLLNAYTVDIPAGKELIAYRTTSLVFKLDGTPKRHEATEYVVGYTCHCERSGEAISKMHHGVASEHCSGALQHCSGLAMHIHKDGRVELKCQH